MTVISTPVDKSVTPQWVGNDPASEAIRETAARAAASSSTLLIRGETGAGKNLLAEIVHYLGESRLQPLVQIDCATLPEGLVESELFGYEKGAFTGASQPKAGRLELAGRGTVVLDEIAALAPGTQSKLLRVLDERTFERLGGMAPIRLQARIVALTAADLERGVREGWFREDLFFRLNVLPITVPPLRERPGDVCPLADFFLGQLARLRGARGAELSAGARRALEAYDFPGNARELRNILERALVHASGRRLEREDLPASVLRSAAGEPPARLDEIEREHIRRVLLATHGRKSEAAALLGISRKTLLAKRRRYRLD